MFESELILEVELFSIITTFSGLILESLFRSALATSLRGPVRPLDLRPHLTATGFRASCSVFLVFQMSTGCLDVYPALGFVQDKYQ